MEEKKKVLEPQAQLDWREGPDSAFLKISGSLVLFSLDPIWQETFHRLAATPSRKIIVDASGVHACDVSGISFLSSLRNRQLASSGSFELTGLRPEFQKLFDYAVEPLGESLPKEKTPLNPIEKIGKAVVDFADLFSSQIAFIGAILWHSAVGLKKRRYISFRDIIPIMQAAGVNAVPIIFITGILIGTVMGFQSAAPLQLFGSDVFVANIVVFAIFRELGPLLTAILLTGRTAASFAAELGTMKVNEEIDALETMGLEPVRFLVISRVVALVLLAPILTIFMDIGGVLGGIAVFKILGYPVTSFFNQVIGLVALKDIVSGLVKALVFGFIVAAVGCQRGLSTRSGASAVGVSTTSAVVESLTLVFFADGIFSVIFYYLNI
jgi:phospholipid/cholesterol/gamma-HCH transport system permease protein